MKAKFDREMNIVSKEIPAPPLEDIRAALGFKTCFLSIIYFSYRKSAERKLQGS